MLSACLRIPQPVKYSTMMSPPSVAALQSSSSVAAKKKMTPAQARSLTAMRACLTCHLCDKRFTEPATLMACMHSFCHSCILEYTEDNWYCPVTGCGAPVACKGGSNEAIKKNPIISAVASSLQSIEKIIESAPEHWWIGQQDEGQENIPDHNSEGEDDGVVDFQMFMDTENSTERNCERGGDLENNYAHDGSNTTKGREKVEGRKTLSIDQSIFPPDKSMKFNSTPPVFSCSPIAMQSSQAETTLDGKEQQPTPTCHTLQCDIASLDRKSGTNPSPASEQSPSIVKKTPTSMTQQSGGASLMTTMKTSPDPTPRRASRVSFQQQPRVILLNPSSTLSNEHSRCLRRCVNDGFISILKSPQHQLLDASDYVDEFDSGFDFDTEEDRQFFLDLLSSNRSENRPPASASFYAISTERDMNFSVGEAIIVPRSLSYYLSVAAGLPIVDIEFISSAASMKRSGTMSHQRYPFPYISISDGKLAVSKKHSGSDYLVLGASNYTWDAPMKARDAAMHRHLLWQDEKGPHSKLETLLPGTDLLHAYSVVLVGEFDQNCHSKRTNVAKRRRHLESSKVSGSDYCTRGNICLLLQLCGANVYNIDCLMSSKQIKKGLTVDQLSDVKSAVSLGANINNQTTLEHDLNDCLEGRSQHKPRNLLVMVKDSSDIKVGIDFLAQLNLNGSVLPAVVTCQWLLDSIGEFEVKETTPYSS